MEQKLPKLQDVIKVIACITESEYTIEVESEKSTAFVVFNDSSLTLNLLEENNKLTRAELASKIQYLFTEQMPELNWSKLIMVSPACALRIPIDWANSCIKLKLPKPHEVVKVIQDTTDIQFTVTVSAEDSTLRVLFKGGDSVALELRSTINTALAELLPKGGLSRILPLAKYVLSVPVDLTEFKLPVVYIPVKHQSVATTVKAFSDAVDKYVAYARDFLGLNGPGIMMEYIRLTDFTKAERGIDPKAYKDLADHIADIAHKMFINSHSQSLFTDVFTAANSMYLSAKSHYDIAESVVDGTCSHKTTTYVEHEDSYNHHNNTAYYAQVCTVCGKQLTEPK